jgi:hypothetical protein
VKFSRFLREIHAQKCQRVSFYQELREKDVKSAVAQAVLNQCTEKKSKETMNKTRIFRAVETCFLSLMYAALAASGQGTFTYDQQISAPPQGFGFHNPSTIQSQQPIGQSFTPFFASVSFIQLNLGDDNPGNSQGATVFVNLRGNSISGNSISGTVLATSSPVFMPDGFGDNGFGASFPGITNFFFASPVTVTPGTTYDFDIVVQSGDAWEADAYHYGYSGGTAFFNGTTDSGNDLWFREGIVVPEPSVAGLVSLGSGVLFYVRRAKNRK